MPQIAPFGTTATGQPVDSITLSGGGLTVGLLTWGAVVRSVRLAGVDHDLTLGSDRLADYEGEMRHHGSLIAPVVNRIGGASAVIDGQVHRFDANLGPHCLHSGQAGTHLKVWRCEGADATSATLSLDLPDGEGGFPGNRRVTARFSLRHPATLRLEISATTDRPTLWNATNHSYWNLDGTPTWGGHALQVDAEHWLETDSLDRPTGTVTRAAGSPMDFRAARMIFPGQPPLDNCFVLSGQRAALRRVASLTGQSGVTLDVATTEAGLQIYDGRAALRPGGQPYEGIALETQGWPDATGHDHFPPILLCPDEPFRQITEWRFARPAQAAQEF